MTRNVMTKTKAAGIARLMVKKKASAYAGANSLAQFNKGELFSESATGKVLHAFRLAVLNSDKYSIVDKLYAEKALLGGGQ